jgi:hypothetical protein
MEKAMLANRNQVAPVDTSKIVGWGVDADPDNDPTYPFRDRHRDAAPYSDRPTQQHSDVEVLQSVEFKHTPAVFGTTVPPSGVSGMIRRWAFRWTESNWLHWLLLMGADRLQVAEGVVSDLARGKVPNIPAEMGARSEWQYNKRGLASKTLVSAVLAIGLLGMVRFRKGRRK